MLPLEIRYDEQSDVDLLKLEAKDEMPLFAARREPLHQAGNRPIRIDYKESEK